MNSAPTRVTALDGLRGVACLAVLLMHIGSVLRPFGESPLYALIPGTPAVMVFFALSGVVLSLAPLCRQREGRAYDWLSYFPRRVVRLCVPLFAAIALGIAAGWVAWRLGATSRSAVAIDFAAPAATVVHDVLMQFDVLFNVSDDLLTLTGAPLVRVNSPVWSMSWELWFSLTLPLALWFLTRVRKDAAAALAILAGIFVSFWSGYFPLRLCLMFWLGILLAKYADELSRVRINPAAELAATAGLLAAASAFRFTEGMGGATHALASTAMCAASAGLVALTMTDGLVRRALSCRACQALGRLSFSIYLTHAVVVSGIGIVGPRLGIGAPLAQAALALAGSLGFAWVFWRLVEKPSMDLSRRIR